MNGGWAWAGARAVGTSHLAQHLPCQDRFACRSVDRAVGGPWLVAALADGAGSAERAEQGAALATSTFVDAACAELGRGARFDDATAVLRSSVLMSRIGIEEMAFEEQRSRNDYASTLLVAVLGPQGGAIGQIGDGACVVYRKADGWQPVHWPDHGEFANSTTFLTQGTTLEFLRVETLVAPVQRIALFSDGLERLVLDFRARTAHAPFFDSIFHRLSHFDGHGEHVDVSRELGDLLASDRVNTRTDDDKSLLCAEWREG